MRFTLKGGLLGHNDPGTHAPARCENIQWPLAVANYSSDKVMVPSERASGVAYRGRHRGTHAGHDLEEHLVANPGNWKSVSRVVVWLG